MCSLKCPFCQQELLLSSFRDGDKDNEVWNCLHCQIGGKRKLWQELIRTEKQLKIYHEFVTKLYLNGNITDKSLKRLQKLLYIQTKGGNNE